MLLWWLGGRGGGGGGNGGGGGGNAGNPTSPSDPPPATFGDESLGIPSNLQHPWGTWSAIIPDGNCADMRPCNPIGSGYTIQPGAIYSAGITLGSWIFASLSTFGGWAANEGSRSDTSILFDIIKWRYSCQAETRDVPNAFLASFSSFADSSTPAPVTQPDGLTRWK